MEFDTKKSGTSYGGILKLVWPLALGMVNNALMQFVDRAFLAKYSMAALEAVLPASMLAFVAIGFFQSLVGYSGTFVAQYHGAGDPRMGVVSYRAGVMIAIVSGLLMFAFMPLGDLVFRISGHSAEVRILENEYYKISTGGGIFLFLQMAASAYFTGRGHTRLVFAVNVLGNILNIALDPIFIFGWLFVPEMGVAGAAYATVASMAVQWIVLASVIAAEQIKELKEVRVRISLADFMALVWRILKFGVPSGGYSVLNILSFTVFVFVTGGVSDVAFAVSNACFTVNYLLFAPMEGFALGAATLVGQAQGRGDSEAARRDGMRTVLLGVVTVVVPSLLVVALYRPILAVFAPENPLLHAEFISTGFILLVLMAAWQVFDAADVIISGALKGAGDTGFVMWWILVVAFGFWLPLVFVVVKFCNTMPALWATMVAYVVFMFVGSIIRWKRGKWMSIKVLKATNEIAPLGLQGN